MALFERLPYDLLRIIFDYLDVHTLLNACLVAHAPNEVASWSLYTSIIFNPDAMNGNWYSKNMDYLVRRNPIEALERRPHLRNAVRNVTMCTSKVLGYYAYHQRHDDHTRQNAQYCYKALVLLPNVTFLGVRDCTMEFEWDLLSKSIPQLRSLRVLELQGIGVDIGQLPHSTAIDIHAELTAETVLDLAQTSMAHKVRTLATGTNFYDMSVQELSFNLKFFSRLTRLSITRFFRVSPAEICQLVAAVPTLREALFLCALERETGNIVPTGAKNLTYLRIQFSHRDRANESGTLKLLVQCVAEQSRLQRLDIIAAASKPKALNGNALLSKILPLHGRTLEKLKLPNYHISSAKLGQLLSRCDRLNVLWLGVTPQLRAHLSELLSKSTSLRKLRIYAEGTWRFVDAQAILRQTCQTLREFKVCAKHGIVRENASWKGRWEYDDLLQKPIILVDGPLSASFSSYARRTQYIPSYRESGDEQITGGEQITGDEWITGDEQITAGEWITGDGSLVDMDGW